MPAETVSGGLAGLRVLVTRPAHQAGGLCRLLEQEGATALVMPVIEIADPADTQPLRSVLAQLDRFDIAIFVSANAVDKTCEWLARSDLRWPPGLMRAAVGPGSAAALGRHGLPADLLPARDFGSEGLLDLAPLQQVAGRRVVIFRGEGGRELLAETLRQRGAEVVHAQVYRRILPPDGADALHRIALHQPVDVVIVTSNEGLTNLYALAGEAHRDWLLQKPLVVISRRTAQLAGTLGFRRGVWVAGEASDHGLLAAVLRWRAGQQGATDKEKRDAH